MRRWVFIVLMSGIIVFSLTACWDAKEIDRWAYVLAIGVDKGVENELRFTFLIPTMKQETGTAAMAGGATGQSGEQGRFTTVSVDAPTFFAGVNMVESSVSKILNYMHAKFVIISEDLAREGVAKFINGMIRDRQIRGTNNIVIAKGKASEYVEGLSPALTGTVSKALEGIMDTYSDSGLFFKTSYFTFMKDLKSTYGMPVAPVSAMNDFSRFRESGAPPENFKSEGDYYAGELPRKGGNNYDFLGTALFDGDKMVGELNGDETRVLAIIKGIFKKASIAIADPRNNRLRITIDTRLQKKPDIKVDFNEGKPVIHVKVFLEGDIENLQGTTEYESVKLKPVLENAFKAYIKGIIDKTIEKCKNLNVDVFDFGEKAAMHFLTIPEWEKYNWLSRFKDAAITTEVEFTVKWTGKLLKINPVRNSRGEKK